MNTLFLVYFGKWRCVCWGADARYAPVGSSPNVNLHINPLLSSTPQRQKASLDHKSPPAYDEMVIGWGQGHLFSSSHDAHRHQLFFRAPPLRGRRLAEPESPPQQNTIYLRLYCGLEDTSVTSDRHMPWKDSSLVHHLLQSVHTNLPTGHCWNGDSQMLAKSVHPNLPTGHCWNGDTQMLATSKNQFI